MVMCFFFKLDMETVRTMMSSMNDHHQTVELRELFLCILLAPSSDARSPVVRPGAPSSFLLLVVRPGAPSSFLVIVARIGAPSSFLLLVARPGAPRASCSYEQ